MGRARPLRFSFSNTGNTAAINTVASVAGAGSRPTLNLANGLDQVTQFSASIPANAWTHLAFVKSGTVLKLYVNGVADATTGSFAGYTATLDSRTKLRIGNAHTVDVPFTGRMDDLRIVKGGALYSTNFTPAGPS